MKSNRFAQAFCLLLLTTLSLLPWILFGLQGPFSDAVRFLYIALSKFGLLSVDWNNLLFSYGTGMLFDSPFF